MHAARGACRARAEFDPSDFEKPARSAQVEAWSRSQDMIQDRGSEFRTRDSGCTILIFRVLWKSESELRIIGNFNTN